MIDQNLVKKWEELMTTLTVSKKSKLLCSIEEIERVEDELNFKFPRGYKEYSLLFGSGSLGLGDMPDSFRIYCPCCPQTRFDIRNTGHSLVGLKIDLDGYELNEDQAVIANRLLENGYAFGGTPSADDFFWDLSSYSEADQSYDIYWKADENVEDIKLVGRDFFEFIERFCLGDGLQVIYSDEFEEFDSNKKYFSAFEIFDESYNHDYFISSMFNGFWENIARHQLFSENAKVGISCTYDAANKEQADCLESKWKEESNVKIEMIIPTKRPNIPRLIEITVTKRGVNREFVEELLRKMERIGKECGCHLGSSGFRLSAE